ncbi:hypothetical protein ACGFY7_31400 [Streptomyces prunicolor]|uniref:hypothetical protein n=1 Tax=Streptomyces prunicolor TaxID=67348 RepID=UPI00372330AE
MNKGKKIAVGVGGLIAAPVLVAGVILGVENAAAHDTSTAASTPGMSGTSGTPNSPGSPGLPGVGHSSPAAKPSASATTSGPAQKLSDLDGIGRPAVEYQQVLDALAPRCTEDRPRLATVVGSTLEHLKKNGVDDEDAFSLLQHLEQFVPAGNPRVNCASAAATYATQREGS